MNNRLLTLEDLYDFYSKKKKSLKFNAEKSGYNIAIQTKATFEVNDDLSEGLLYGKIRAFHDLTNNNKSHIETDVLEDKMMSIKDRPIMADIVDTGETDENGEPIKDFSGHTMYYDEDSDKMIYKEIPVGHFINPENIHLEYDEKLDRNFVCSDVVVYEEYTDTCEILRRRKTVDCSVELCIRAMHWDNTDKTLHLDDFYVQGTTLLGSDVLPGMQGSKLTLKDFSEENNSIFSSILEDEHSKLIETLDKLNKTLSSLNIEPKTNQIEKFEKGGNKKIDMTKFEELLKKYNKKTEDITFEYEELSDEELEKAFSTAFAESDNNDEKDSDIEDDDKETKENHSEDDKKDDTDSDTDDEPENSDEDATDDSNDSDDVDSDEKDDEKKENESCKDKEKYSKTFELSHDDIRSALYELLAPLEETLNEYDLEYTGKGAFNIVSICNDTGVQFKLINNYGCETLCTVFYNTDTKEYKIISGGFMYMKVYKDLDVVIDCKNMTIEDSIGRMVTYDKLGISDIGYMYWLRLMNGNNSIMFHGNCEFTIEHIEARKVGE